MAINHIKVGSILKSTGVKGELKLEVEENLEDDVLKAKHIFVLINGDFVPYFVESVRDQDSIIIKFDDVHNPESANKLTRKEIYLRDNQITSKKYHKGQELSSLIGYRLYNEDTLVSIIDNISILPQQIMAEFEYMGKSKMVPLVEDWIKSIHHKEKRINMVLPDGILDI
jgi:16S rRNA processing protein RimM